MSEALRLVRSGRLSEATRLLQARTDARANESILRQPQGGWNAPDKGVETCTPALRLPRQGSQLPHKNAATARAEGRRSSLPGRFEDGHFSNFAGSLAYKLYVPENPLGKPMPLVIMLHGCTQSPDDFAAGTRMNEIAEEHGFLVAYPAQPASANPSRCWNWFRRSDQQRDAGEPALIAGLTRHLIAEFGADPRRVYAAGLSAGGAAAAVLGFVYPDVYAAIGIHSGLAYGSASNTITALDAMRRGGPARGTRAHASVPTITFHGDADSTVNPVNADRIIEDAITPASRATVQHGAVSGRQFSRTTYADASGTGIAEDWRIVGGAHAWSGGSGAGTYTDTKGPDASAEMIRFFLEHQLRV